MDQITHAAIPDFGNEIAYPLNTGLVAPANILVVDDDPFQQRLLSVALEAEGYAVQCAASATEAWTSIARTQPDLILLDVLLPDISGYEITRQLKSQKSTAGIPVIMITGLDDRNARLRGLREGAEDFLIKPVDRSELAVRVRNLLNLKKYSDLLHHHNRVLARQIDEKTQQVRQHCIETVLTLTRAAEYRDETTGNHVSRISYYTATMSEYLGLDSAFRDQIFYASPMHDIGKLAIPDHILLKPGPLSPDEWEIMKTHTTLGREILLGNKSPYLEMGADIAQHHHELWDGTGYPARLAGENIPLSARIMGICDVYDALRSKRPYKVAHTHEDAVDIIRTGDRRIHPEQFDPQLLDAFFACNHQFKQIYGETTQRAQGH